MANTNGNNHGHTGNANGHYGNANGHSGHNNGNKNGQNEHTNGHTGNTKGIIVAIMANDKWSSWAMRMAILQILMASYGQD